MTHPARLPDDTTTIPGRSSPRGLPAAVIAGAVIAALAIVAMALAGLGSRWGWWHFRTGFTVLRWSGYLLLGAGIFTLFASFVPRRHGGGLNRRAILVGITVALVAFATVAVPWQWRRTARTVPAIHDITTDTENPPPFVAILERRTNAKNPAEYGGAEVAAKQRAAYPDIVPVNTPLPVARAVERAADVAREMGWTIVDVDTLAGRVEATDRTRWFGFYDDVVIRVTPTQGGSRVDVRSLSRVGGSDVGTNAARIRAFVRRFGTGAAGSPDGR